VNIETLAARNCKAFGLPGIIDPGAAMSKSSWASSKSFILLRSFVTVPKNALWAVRGKTKIVTTIAIAAYIETGMSKPLRRVNWVKGKRGPMAFGGVRKKKDRRDGRVHRIYQLLWSQRRS
jgi:hypothetical protein